MGISSDTISGKNRNSAYWSLPFLLAAMLSAPATAGTLAPGYDDTVPPPQVQSPAAGTSRPPGDIRQASRLMVQGAYDRASAMLLEIVAAEPDNVQAQAQLGIALGRQYKLDEADEHFDKALAVEPKNPVAHCGKAMVLLYRVEKNQLGSLTREQALHQAGRECNLALDADPRVVEAHYLLGMVFKEEHRLDLAMQAFSGAIRLDPRYVRAYNQLAAVQVSKGKLSEAAEDYKQSLSIEKSLSAHLGLAEIYVKQSRFEDAMAELNNALAMNPDSVTVHLALARALEARGNSASAITQYEQTIRIKPDETEAYLAIADLRNAQGEYNMAIEQLQAALKANEHDHQLHARLVNELLLSGRVDDLIRESKAGLGASPDSAAEAFGLAMGYYASFVSHLDPARSSTPEFLSAAHQIADAAKRTPANLTLSLANAMMQALAGQTVDLTRLKSAQTTDDRLLNANLLMALHRYQEASVMTSTAVNNALNAGDVMKIADEALVMRDLDGADEAYRRGLTFVGQDLRARRGLARSAELRQQATDEVARGKIYIDNKQYRTAVDKLHDAVAANPRLAEARLTLAEALEKEAPSASDQLAVVREALAQYQAYLALSPSLPPRDLERTQRHIDRLETVVNHAQSNSREGWRSLLQRLSVL